MQTMIVVLILLAAAAYIGRRAWRTVRAGGDGESGGSCNKCH